MGGLTKFSPAGGDPQSPPGKKPCGVYTYKMQQVYVSQNNCLSIETTAQRKAEDYNYSIFWLQPYSYLAALVFVFIILQKRREKKIVNF